MDYFMLLLAFLAGGLVCYLVAGPIIGMGPFEKGLMTNLALGKKVVISIDNQCFIYEMVGDRVKITEGVTEFLEAQDELDSFVVGDSDTDKSVHDLKINP